MRSFKTYDDISRTSGFQESSANLTSKSLQKSKLMKRWATGLSLGAIGTMWICSGRSLFTLGMLFTSLVGQNEYYAIVQATGNISCMTFVNCQPVRLQTVYIK
jgi:hypothetical protein